MPKPKQFLKESKTKSKHAPKIPSTADEWLADGVDLEEAGEKWRGGDAAKSMRFFGKAIDAYETGLRNFPTSFDLAYNIARLRYEVTHHPRLLNQLPQGSWTLTSLLQQALASSKAAAQLKQDDADVLFNTGQILTSLADEQTAKGSSNSDGDRASCVLLEEGIDYFNSCFTIQQAEFAKFEVQIASANNEASFATETSVPAQTHEESSGSSPSSSAQGEKEEEWVSVRQPVTRDDVLDTILALVETLSTLCSRSSRLERQSDAQKFLHTVEQFGTPTLLEQLSAIAALTERQLDAAIAQAGLVSAVSEAKYRLGFSGNDFKAYFANIQQAWSSFDLTNHAQGLWNRAETYTTAAQAISDHDLSTATPSPTQTAMVQSCWDAYTLAAADLTVASKFRDDENIGKIFLTRGDIELLRASLGRSPYNLPAASKNGELLTRNAEKHYRGAKVLTQSSGEREENEEAIVKEALVKALLGDGSELALVTRSVARAGEILVEAANDGLVEQEMLASIIP